MSKIMHGSVCVPLGFSGAGVSCGIKKSGDKDLALLVSEVPCAVAGTFTTNSVKAAPVLFDLKRIHRGGVWGVVVNSGNANACTGEEGLRNSSLMSEMATLATKGSKKADFLVCSTGRIGTQLPMDKIETGIKNAASRLVRNGKLIAESIMTTDTFPKEAAIQLKIGGKTVRIGGIAKGAGMIAPGMSASGKRPALHATMLSFITTDIAISKSDLQSCLNKAVGQSFNRITVDGDMSTNDTVMIFANGMAKNRLMKAGSRDLKRFQEALDYITLTLAKMIVKDGEGISKIVKLIVKGASTKKDSELAVRAIGNSTLVKCSWCGEDPNWGRIIDAIGYSGAKFNLEKVSIDYDGIYLVKNGLQKNENLNKVQAIIKKPNFTIICDLGFGKHSAILYTTDLTEKYVELNKGE